MAGAGALVLGLLLPTSPTAAVTLTVWDPPRNLSATASVATTPQVAMSADGARIATVWDRAEGTTHTVQVSTSSDGGLTWASPINLSVPADLSGTGVDGLKPRVAMSADGTRIAAVWQYWDGTWWVIQERHSTDLGASWSGTTSLTDPGEFAFTPTVALSADGARVTSAWIRFDGVAQNWIVQTRSSSDGGALWTTSTNLSASDGNGEFPEVHASADGQRVTATWLRYLDGAGVPPRTAQASSSLDGGATWSTVPTDLSPSGIVGTVDLAMSADGSRQFSVWSKAGEVHLTASDDSGVTWSTPTRISPMDEVATGPGVDASSDGATVAVQWQQDIGNVDFDLRSTTSKDGATSWSMPVTVAGTAIRARTTMSSDGTRIVAVWVSGVVESPVVTASTSVNGGASWSDPAPLSEPATSENSPVVAIASDGTRVVAAWPWETTAETIVQAAVGQFVVPVPPALSAPAVVTQPVDATVTVGASASFTSTATGVPAPSVQWQTSTDGGATWVDVRGATGTTLTLPGVTAAQDGARVRAVFTNAAGAATSAAATLTVTGGTTPPPVDPATVTVLSPNSGSPISSGGYFGVTAATTNVGMGAIAYLTLNGTAKAQTLVDSNGIARFEKIPAETGDYAVRIGPPGSTTVSDPFTLTIRPFAITGHTALPVPAGTPPRVQFTIATGNWSPGTVIALTRNGRATATVKVTTTGTPVTVTVPAKPGRYQVRVDSRQGWVYGDHTGIVALT